MCEPKNILMGKNKLEEMNIITYGICTYYAWVCMKQPLQLSNQSVWPNSLGIETTIAYYIYSSLLYRFLV